MEKDLFLTSLALRLSEGGMPKDEIDKRVKYFDEKLSELEGGACEEKIKQLGGDVGVAQKLLSDYRRAPTTTIPSVPKNDKPKRDINELLDDEDDDSDVKTVQPKRKPSQESTSRAPSKVSESKKVKGDSQHYNKEKVKNFKILTIALCPVWLFLALIIAALFAALFAGVALVTLACAVVLVLIAAGGTAFALVSIIYGVTQLGTAMPAGLYEIGMGIVCGGLTMFAGIVLYNFIVRLVPFIYKKLVVLVKFVIKQIQRLYAYAKGEFCKE